MSIYTIVLFVHIIGAIGLFLSIGSWLFILMGLRRAQRIEEVRALMHVNELSSTFGDGSGLLLIIAGLYLTLSAWSLLTSWIIVALISLILIILTNATLIGPRRGALIKQLERSAPEGEISLALWQHIHNPVLWTMSQTTAILLLGIVFLMTTRPDLGGSVTVMAVALVLGLLSSLLVSRSIAQNPDAQAQPETLPAVNSPCPLVHKRADSDRPEVQARNADKSPSDTPDHSPRAHPFAAYFPRSII